MFHVSSYLKPASSYHLRRPFARKKIITNWMRCRDILARSLSTTAWCAEHSINVFPVRIDVGINTEARLHKGCKSTIKGLEKSVVLSCVPPKASTSIFDFVIWVKLLKSGNFTPLAPWIPTSRIARNKAKRRVRKLRDPRSLVNVSRILVKPRYGKGDLPPVIVPLVARVAVISMGWMLSLRN